MDDSSPLFEIFNGAVIPGNTQLFDSKNRAFRYGDGVFETICFCNNKLLFLADHFSRLTKGLATLSIPLPLNFNLSLLENSIRQLVTLNKMESARLRLVVYREASGFYAPLKSFSSWHLSITGDAASNYKTADMGYTADVFEDDYKTRGALSNLKTLNSLIYVLAGVGAAENGFDEMLIKNDKGNIIESTSSNIFIRKGKTITTPPLSEGCIEGVMRKQVIAILNFAAADVAEEPVSLNQVMDADEIILTNVVKGAAWIENFRGKIYGNDYCKLINQRLNELK